MDNFRNGDEILIESRKVVKGMEQGHEEEGEKDEQGNELKERQNEGHEKQEIFIKSHYDR